MRTVAAKVSDDLFHDMMEIIDDGFADNISDIIKRSVTEWIRRKKDRNKDSLDANCPYCGAFVNDGTAIGLLSLEFQGARIKDGKLVGGIPVGVYYCRACKKILSVV